VLFVCLQISSDVCLAFLNGCERFIDKTLQGALRTVDDLETRAQFFTDNIQESVVCCNPDSNVNLFGSKNLFCNKLFKLPQKYIIVSPNQILYRNVDLKLENKKHGIMHYKTGVTCVYNGHVFYSLL